jgi:hypothetical protein
MKLLLVFTAWCALLLIVWLVTLGAAFVLWVISFPLRWLSPLMPDRVLGLQTLLFGSTKFFSAGRIRPGCLRS